MRHDAALCGNELITRCNAAVRFDQRIAGDLANDVKSTQTVFVELSFENNFLLHSD